MKKTDWQKPKATKPQATKCESKQLSYLSYWQSRGYRFKRGEKAPENTITPPSFASRHPVLDAVFGGLVLAIGAGGLVVAWVMAGSGITFF